MSSATTPTVAVLYQALAPPTYDGVSKPPKPGGYRDSGSDIAYTLSRTGIPVLTPVEAPDPANENHWCFPDTEEGILSAVGKGATHLWANTVLFAAHPLQTSSLLDACESSLKVVGQPPQCFDMYDDKSFLNDALRRRGLRFPRSWTVYDPLLVTPTSQRDSDKNLPTVLALIPESDYPLVAKPVRGRGSHGVKICYTRADLAEHVSGLFDESPRVLVEEYLSGEEGTVTVLPPSMCSNEPTDCAGHKALPPVVRFNHVDGIAPYSGKVAVTANSHAVSAVARDADPAYADIMKQCEAVGDLLHATAPLRIDIRRFAPRSPFALFDINMKPNITGPGRPGRDDQASLMSLAASELGWEYSTFLQYVLGTAQPLRNLRQYISPLLE
ncbi:uncharacterized protein PFLUO_LOCUS30 [Penicillium psychrofluorescens]|uniref:uncharacterized protein n=1 Tax=Penicillium psychrofluorescens TaxID=3158075 RepID=UPI003CCDA819